MVKEETTDRWSVEPVLDWCMQDARFHSSATALVESLSGRLIEAGTPLWRLRVGFRTLHPQVVAWAYVWQRGKPCEEIRVHHEALNSDMFIGSPIQHVYETGEEFRRDLRSLDPEADYHLLFELREAGGTDYLALPLLFGDRQVNALILTSDSPGGFSDHDCNNFRKLAHYIAPLLEIKSRQRITKALLDTYVGPRTGDRVLKGLVKRGDGEEICAALWFSDLRDFTRLSERLPSDQLLTLLNEYFEFVSAAVTSRGGEVLRFIGDAMLVVFPISGNRSREYACESAFEAAMDTVNSIATVNHTRRRRSKPEIHFGVGLHEGSVVYGNVGAPDRLDFTVMGPAVNRTARLESLSKQLNSQVVMSSEFVSAAGIAAVSRGAFELKGVSEKLEVFTPVD